MKLSDVRIQHVIPVSYINCGHGDNRLGVEYAFDVGFKEKEFPDIKLGDKVIITIERLRNDDKT